MKDEDYVTHPFTTSERFCWFCEKFGKCAIGREEWKRRMAEKDVDIWTVLSQSDFAFLILKLKENYWRWKREVDGSSSLGGSDNERGASTIKEMMEAFETVTTDVGYWIAGNKEEYGHAFMEHLEKRARLQQEKCRERLGSHGPEKMEKIKQKLELEHHFL